VGKTIARLMADAFDAQFIAISAVLGGVKDIREAVALARRARWPAAPAHHRVRGRGAPLQQEPAGRLLAARGVGPVHLHRRDHREPSFEVNSALLSRATVYVLQALTEDDLKQIVAKAQAQALPAIEPEALERLIAYADGDARRLLNTLETVAITAAAEQRSAVRRAWLLKVLGEQLRRYDKGGEQFYDTISALHKSVRGSDPDAALYWLVRMLDGGADPRYMARRLAHGQRGHRPGRPALRLALDAAEV
jgi:putative ATPase